MDLKITRDLLNRYFHDELSMSANVNTLLILNKKEIKNQEILRLLTVFKMYTKTRLKMAEAVNSLFYELRDLLDKEIEDKK